jgi:hypothetical protein
MPDPAGGREIESDAGAEAAAWLTALSTFAAFLVCGAVPLLPFAVDAGGKSVLSLAATALVFFGIGSLKSRWSPTSWWRSGLETLAVGLAAAALAFGIGYWLKALACLPGRAQHLGLAVLLGHHGVDPALAAGRDDAHGALEVIAAEALLAIDLADLLALAVGHEIDMPLLHGAQFRVLVAFGLGAAEVAGRHREPVADEVGRTQDENDPRREVCPDDAGDDREGGDGAIDAAIDPVPEIADGRAGREPPSDRGAVVAVLESGPWTIPGSIVPLRPANWSACVTEDA